MKSSSLFPVTLAVTCAFSLAACRVTETSAEAIDAVMGKARYTQAGSKWSVLVQDAKTGEVVYARDPDRMSFTGSVRKLFSVGTALNTVGPQQRFTTTVHYTGNAPAQGLLPGDLVLVAAGDLSFGGRAKPDGTLDFTDFDHNEAHAFGGSGLTPQDPLVALDALARQVRAAGIEQVGGDVLIDDRLFDSFRVPNGNTLISPMLINENLLDVTLTPSTEGQPAALDWRPRVSGFTLAGAATTARPGAATDVMLSAENFGQISLGCLGTVGCQGLISSVDGPRWGSIPLGYQAPLVGNTQFVGVLKAEDPPTLARMAFIDALQRAGVSVAAPTVARNASQRLPPRESLLAVSRVASYSSEPYAEQARLILKVSLNTGANLSLMHAGLAQGHRTVAKALLAERQFLVDELGLDPAGFDFPTNGSGSPDSRATARTTAKLAAAMRTRPVYATYRASLPRMGVDGSLAAIGKTLAGKAHISAKSGATINAQGQMAAMSLAGYIDAQSGRALTFAIFVNDAGPVTDLSDTLEVFEDEAQIASILYENY